MGQQAESIFIIAPIWHVRKSHYPHRPLLSSWRYVDLELPTYPIKVNALEAGLLLMMIECSEEGVKPALSGIRNQLITLKKDIEGAEGVVKKILPNGMLEITDRGGYRIVREPYSWEIGGN